MEISTSGKMKYGTLTTNKGKRAVLHLINRTGASARSMGKLKQEELEEISKQVFYAVDDKNPITGIMAVCYTLDVLVDEFIKHDDDLQDIYKRELELEKEGSESK